MTGPAARRGVLRGLTTLALIGGGIALLGSPSAVAEPVTADLLDSYDAWLEYERRHLQWERVRSRPTEYRLHPPFVMQMRGEDVPCDFIPAANAGARFHGNHEPLPSTRAALVLSAVGCEWREGLR